MSGAHAQFAPITFADLSGWESDDHASALRAFAVSVPRCCPVLSQACHDALAALKADPAQARRFFETRFTPHRVVHDRPQGLLTGYYEPEVAGSRVRDGVYQVPVYRRPPDLINLVDEAARATVGDGYTHLRRTASGDVPYPTREDIETGALAGQGLELFYLADPVDAFFMQVQGSGVIRLPDGDRVRITYDGKNGHPYTSIGRYLVDSGTLALQDVTLDALGRWLRDDPERGRRVMWQNASYVFFRELVGDEAGAAKGVLNTPLVAGRSLAVDTSVHALGTPIYVAAPTLTTFDATGAPFQRLMIAHDVGSAIKGPERGDIYYGSGDDAGRRAGVTKHAGNFYALLPNPVPPDRTQ